MCHSRPFAPWNVSSSTPAVARPNGSVASPHARNCRAAARRLRAQEHQQRPADLLCRFELGRRAGRGRCSRARPAPTAAGRSRRGAGTHAAAWCRAPSPRRAPAGARRRRRGERGGDRRELGVGAGEHRHAVGPHQAGIEAGDHRGHAGGFAVLVVVGDDLRGRAVGPRRPHAGRLPVGAQRVRAGVDHLGRRPVVGGQAHDLDAGEPRRHVEQQTGVGAVEPVDRLCRVAHQEQVVAAEPELVDEPVLERVEVLRLVDEHVPEPPAHDVGELRFALERLDRATQQVVEVDDLAPALLLPVAVEHRRRRCPRRPAALRSPRRTAPSYAAAVEQPRGRPVHLGHQQLDVDRVYSSRGTDLRSNRRRSDATVHGRWSRSRQRCCSRPSATEWNVPAVQRPCSPRRGSRRRSSPAASRVNVSTTVWASSAVPAGDPVRHPPGEHPGLARSGAGDDRHQHRLGGHRQALLLVEVGEQRPGVHRGNGTGCARPAAVGATMWTRGSPRSRTVRTMPYPKKLLNDYETVALDLHPHWWSFSEPACRAHRSVVLGIVSLLPSTVTLQDGAPVGRHRCDRRVGRLVGHPLPEVGHHQLRDHQRPDHLPQRRHRQERHRDPARARQQRAVPASRSSSACSAPATCSSSRAARTASSASPTCAIPSGCRT